MQDKVKNEEKMGKNSEVRHRKSKNSHRGYLGTIADRVLVARGCAVKKDPPIRKGTVR